MSMFKCKHAKTFNTILNKQYNEMLTYFVFNHYYVHEQQLFNFHHYFDNKFSSLLLFTLEKMERERVRQMVETYRKNIFVHLKQKSSNKW